MVAGAVSAETPWPTRAWKTSTPEAQQLDTAALERLDQEFARGEHGYVDGMLIIRNGHVVYEKSYVRDYDRPQATRTPRAAST